MSVSYQPNILEVKTLQEAQALARSLCQQHSTLLSGITSEEAAKAAATKIFSDELLRISSQREDHGRRENTILKAKDVHRGDPSGFLSSMRTSLPELNNNQRCMPAEGLQRCMSVSALSLCPYCNEPSSRFCKESGKRHETALERVKRRWHTVFRQLSVVGKLVNMTRLQKSNTCAEEFFVSLEETVTVEGFKGVHSTNAYIEEEI